MAPLLVLVFRSLTGAAVNRGTMMKHSWAPFLPSRFTGEMSDSHMLRGNGQRGSFTFLMLQRLTELRCLISQILRGGGWRGWSDVVFLIPFLIPHGRGLRFTGMTCLICHVEYCQLRQWLSRPEKVTRSCFSVPFVLLSGPLAPGLVFGPLLPFYDPSHVFETASF